MQLIISKAKDPRVEKLRHEIVGCFLAGDWDGWVSACQQVRKLLKTPEKHAGMRGRKRSHSRSSNGRYEEQPNARTDA